MKKIYLSGIICLFLIVAVVVVVNVILHRDPFYFLKPNMEIEKILVASDKDKDGITDPDDILEGARMEIKNHPQYKSGYYAGGYPPETEGVCTDVIWRALKNTGYDLKSAIDKDISGNLKDYANSVTKPDRNIDFRRVKNQYVFLKKFTQNLTTDVIPYDKDNLLQWQRGDIVVLPEHIAIISDKRRKDGVPYIIHNASTYPMEEDKLLKWATEKKIIGHFRYYKD